MSDKEDVWYVWVPARAEWVALASWIEARVFAKKFDGTIIARDGGG